jgi:hypothetical protein
MELGSFRGFERAGTESYVWGAISEVSLFRKPVAGQKS